MSELPSWASHLEDKPAPMPLLLVQAFVNTLDRERGTDILGVAEDARAWLAQAGLDGGQDLPLVREVRESLRALIGHNTDRRPLSRDELQPLSGIWAGPELEMTADGQVELAAGGLARLLLIVRDAQADGTWDRLKLCGNPDCRWAFYDRSHSRRGAWCDMASCGNRIKNRNLRARRAHQS